MSDELKNCPICGENPFVNQALSCKFASCPRCGIPPMRDEIWQSLPRREDAQELVEALRMLLDVFERCEAGFAPHVEIRFVTRDKARAALAKRGK